MRTTPFLYSAVSKTQVLQAGAVCLLIDAVIRPYLLKKQEINSLKFAGGIEKYV